jgi:hypothetical protein
MEQIPNFPKNLAYNLRKLQGSIIKQKLRISADKTDYNPNEIIRFNFPIGRMIELRSVVLAARAIASGTGGIHFPRLGLNSLIEQLQITANGRILQNTQMYNYIYNLIADIDGYSSQEQGSKRITELFDPSIYIATNYSAGVAVPVVTNGIRATSTGDDYYLYVNNWLGFMGSSCSVLDTNNLGQVQLSITLAPNTCLFYATDGTGTTRPTNANYKLQEVDLLLDTITFTNSLYYELVQQKLVDGGLNVAYYDYIATMGNQVTKSSSTILNFSTQINANSLDQVIATFRPASYNEKINRLLLGATIDNESLSSLLSTPTKFISSTNHGGFNNTNYFRRDGTSFRSSQWYINSQPFIQNKNIHEVINNTLQALNYANLDVGSGSFHPGIISPHSYGTHYFADILSLENLSGDNNWWVSGLSGNGGTIQIQYQATFAGSGDSVTDTVTTFGSGSTIIPVIIARVSKVLNIKQGRLLDVME